MNNEPVSLWSFFFAITIASFFYFFKKIGEIKIIHFFLIFFGTIISLIFTISLNINLKPTLIYIFISGFIAVTAMILPGVSGAYILLILGVYSTLIKSVDDLQSVIVKFNSEIFVNSLSTLSVFFIGSIICLKVMSKYISVLLKKYPKKTLSFLLGLMLGSVHKIWPWQNIINFDESNIIKNKSIVLPYNYDGPPDFFKAFIFMSLGALMFFILSGIKKLKA
jgi:putative membrane protein